MNEVLKNPLKSLANK